MAFFLQSGAMGVISNRKQDRTKGNDSVAPFLKWAGGKRWLTSKYGQLFPAQHERYIEPFFGSGSVFFYLDPKRAILSDTNRALIRTYETIRDHWREVEFLLGAHAQRHSKMYYYHVRNIVPEDDVGAAARLIYLNRTCWNGLYRVNKDGMFNVPIGTKTRVLMGDDFGKISDMLRRAHLRCCDFTHVLSEAQSGDFAYVDPPYTVKHNNNGFLKYNEQIFTWEDQERLQSEVTAAVARGAKVLVSNAAHDSVRELYRGVGEVLEIHRQSVIAASASARGRETELLIKCY